MVQCCLGLVLRLETYEAKLSELAIFGELEAAVRQRAKGSKQLPEPLLLHLEQKGIMRGGVPGAKGQISQKPRGPGGIPEMSRWRP